MSSLNKEMLINVTRVNESKPEQLRLAITQNNELIDLDIENPGAEQIVSNIYKGTISSIEPSLGAVFVNFGREKHGFLPIKEISPEYFPEKLRDTFKPHDRDFNIKKLVKIGDEIVVQVDKEERGTKGAALTTYISLAGSYLVLMPNNPRASGISRRIVGDNRDELRKTLDSIEITGDMGVIIRTAGIGKSKEELEWDLQLQQKYWEAIKQAAILKPAPYLIHQESDVLVRAVRDYLRQDIDSIIIDDSETFTRVKNYVDQARPNYTEKVKLYTDEMPLFSRYQIEQQIEAAYQREVRLPSGGSIVIDATEALVAIDINSARATKGGNIEETAFQTNQEAAKEIARQLRVRDIGGLVVIDFIDMLSSQHQKEVEQTLKNAMRIDRARIQIGRISRFGLLEMSRQRIRSSLSKTTQISCPKCEGRGTIRTVESICMSIIRLLQEEALRANGADIQIQAPIDIASYLLNEKRLSLRHIQDQTGIKVVTVINENLDTPHYTIKLIKDDHSKNIPSYKQNKLPKVDSASKKTIARRSIAEPAIKQFLTNNTPQKKQSEGLVKRLWDIIFGANEASPANKTPQQSSNKKPQQAHSSKTRTQQSRKPSGNKRPPQKKPTSGNQRKSTEKSKPATRQGGREGQPDSAKRKSTSSNQTRDRSRSLSQRSKAKQPTAEQKNTEKPSTNVSNQTTENQNKKTSTETTKSNLPTTKSTSPAVNTGQVKASQQKPKQEHSKPAEQAKQTTAKPAEQAKKATAKPAEQAKQTTAKPAEQAKQTTAKPAEQAKPQAIENPTATKPEAKEKPATAKPKAKTPADYIKKTSSSASLQQVKTKKPTAEKQNKEDSGVKE
jgi:ribonuclease E